MKQKIYRQVSNSRNGHVLGRKVRMALGWKDRLIGLLGTKSLEAETGLWLRPCRSIHTIGMSYAIDVIFVDKANKVQKIRPNVLPYRMCRENGISHSVLELPVGTIERSGIRIGDQLEYVTSQ
jgi:uncharacterized membrane protein (UPF0127 family)